MTTRQFLFTIAILFLIPGVIFAQTGIIPVYLKFRADKVYILEEGNVEIVADLYIGTWENPAQNVYTASLDLTFPSDVVFSNSTSFRYNPSSFFGKEDNVVVLNKAPGALKEGSLNISISRNDGKSINGFGKVGEVQFVILGDLIGSRNVDETFFTVKAEHIKLVDVDGNELPHETDEAGATITIVNDILAREGRALNTPQATVFPNPASDQLYIQLRNLTGERLEIFNVAGQRVLSDQVRGDQLAIDTKGLRSGLYTIKIHTEEGVITRRVLLQ